MRNVTEADNTTSPAVRSTWATPTLRLLPIQESEGGLFSLASVDGTSSS